MYKLLAFIIISMAVTRGITQQNLIFNGDFEIYDTCPTSISTPGDLQIEHCTGWYAPTFATPDYFNTCASWPVSVPSNTMGDRTPYSGYGYCGLLIEYCFSPNGTCDYGWWIEYVQSEISIELKSGYEYQFHCRISLTNKLFAQYAYSKFGALFTTTQINRSDAKSFDLIPQVFNGATNHLLDTNWIELSGIIIAQGGEKYVTLGFFIDTLNPDTLMRPENVDPIADWYYNSYYFLDDIVLIETGNVTNFPNVFTPNSDGKNDYWSPLNLNLNEVIYIYNRWGTLVYILDSENNKWNGKTLNGNLCVDGVYFFSSTFNRNGTIQLINNSQ